MRTESLAMAMARLEDEMKACTDAYTFSSLLDNAVSFDIVSDIHSLSLCTDYALFFKISLFMTYNSDNQQKDFAFLPKFWCVNQLQKHNKKCIISVIVQH